MVYNADIISMQKHNSIKARKSSYEIFTGSPGELAELYPYRCATSATHVPLILEEPELSLHAEVASHIPEMMAQIQKSQKRQVRQILVSAHSSDLLSDEGIAPDEVLLLLPTSAGTKVEVGIEVDGIKQLLDAGLSVAEAVLPRTRPPQAEQLSFL